MRKSRAFIYVLIPAMLFLFLFSHVALAADYKYVGSSKSNKYHYPPCQWAQKIKPSSLITFNNARLSEGQGMHAVLSEQSA